jgi:hypothetical protein
MGKSWQSPDKTFLVHYSAPLVKGKTQNLDGSYRKMWRLDPAAFRRLRISPHFYVAVTVT